MTGVIILPNVKRIHVRKRIPRSVDTDEWRQLDENFELREFIRERKSWCGWQPTREVLVQHIRDQRDDFAKIRLRCTVLGIICAASVLLSASLAIVLFFR